MDKSIKRLKEEVLKLRGYAVVIDDEDEKWEPITTVSVKDAFDLIDQLEIPEVLSQEWIDENKGARINDLRKMTKDDVVLADKLQNLIVPKQELPVIPKYVGDWITKYRKVFDLYPALKKIEDSPLIWERIYEWYRVNTHEFVNAYLTGNYEVADDPLYYALVKGHELIDSGRFYWNFDTYSEGMFPSNRCSEYGRYLTEMSKSEWNKLGINDSNADFVKVEEMEE